MSTEDKGKSKEKVKDELLLEKLKMATFESIKRDVNGKHPTFEYELEFIRRITLKENSITSLTARNFFLKEYSTPMLSSIAADLFHCGYKEIYGEYYEFISQENPETKVPFYKLTLFQGKNNSNLKSYTSTITTRYFTNKKIVDDKTKNKTRLVSIDEGQTLKTDVFGGEAIYNPWFALLLDKEVKKDGVLETKVNKAFAELPEREQLVINLMVKDNASGLEAFEDLKDYLNPREDNPISEWDDKNKQDAMALLKGRALKHLKKILRKNEKVNF